MYEEMMTCRINDLSEIAERLAETLHQLGRKVRKKFGMKPISM